MPSEKVEALVALDGTVAEKVHWTVFPLTLPFTLFTFSWRANTDDKEDNEFSVVYLYGKYLHVMQMVMIRVCHGIALHTVLIVCSDAIQKDGIDIDIKFILRQMSLICCCSYQVLHKRLS